MCVAYSFDVFWIESKVLIYELDRFSFNRNIPNKNKTSELQNNDNDIQVNESFANWICSQAQNQTSQHAIKFHKMCYFINS